MLKTCSTLGLFLAVGIIGGTTFAQNILPKQADLKIDVMGPYHFAVGDLNQDQKADIAVSSWHKLPGKGYKYDRSKHGIYVYLQNSEGKFSSNPDKVLKVKQPRSVVIADLNNDKTNDLTTVERLKGIHMFFNHEKFARDHALPQLGGVSVTAMKAADITGNQKLDLIMDGAWRKQHDKGFALGYFFTQKNPVRIDNIDPCIVDLNGDGCNDVIFGSPKSAQVRIYYGPFSSAKIYPDDIEMRTLVLPVKFGKQFGRIAAGDFNDDGRKDIVISPAGDSNSYVFFQNSPADFTDQVSPSVTLKGLNGQIQSTDFDKDGLNDLVIAERGWKKNRVYVLLQKESGLPSTSKQADCSIKAAGNYGNSALQVADINGDQMPDVIVSSDRGSRPGQIKVFFNKIKKAKESK